MDRCILIDSLYVKPETKFSWVMQKYIRVRGSLMMGKEKGEQICVALPFMEVAPSEFYIGRKVFTCFEATCLLRMGI